MQHVDAGDLHAYLDGALDQLGDERSKRVRRHLQTCEACRERLESERGIRAVADSILEAGSAEVGEVPPFEEIRRRALAVVPGGDASSTEDSPAGSHTKKRVGPWLALSWAASVMLALGVGYAVRSPAAYFTADIQADAATAAADPELAPPDRSAPRTPEIYQDRPAVAASEATPQPPALRDPIDATEELMASAKAADRAVPDPDAPSVRPLAESVELEADRTAASSAAEDARESPARPSAPSAALTGAARADGEARREAASDLGAEWRDALAAAAEPAVLASSGAIDMSSLAVPELEILSIALDPGVPGRSGFRILQRLPMGDTLELRYFGVLSDPAGRFKEAVGEPKTLIPFRDLPNPPLRPGWNQVVIAKGSGWLVARAPMPEQSLDFLLSILN